MCEHTERFGDLQCDERPKAVPEIYDTVKIHAGRIHIRPLHNSSASIQILHKSEREETRDAVYMLRCYEIQLYVQTGDTRCATRRCLAEARDVREIYMSLKNVTTRLY